METWSLSNLVVPKKSFTQSIAKCIQLHRHNSSLLPVSCPVCQTYLQQLSEFVISFTAHLPGLLFHLFIHLILRRNTLRSPLCSLKHYRVSHYNPCCSLSAMDSSKNCSLPSPAALNLCDICTCTISHCWTCSPSACPSVLHQDSRLTLSSRNSFMLNLFSSVMLVLNR